jgi:Flp pilus assembly protein CpaB
MRKVSVLILILIIVTVAAAGVLAYTSTLQRSAQQPAHVTWLDKNGDSITSILLTSSSQAYRSDTVFFTCSSPIGTISLKLSSNVGAVVQLSNSAYTSCSNSANSLVLSVSPTSSLIATGTLQVIQSDMYRILPGQLAINVRVS